MTWSRTVVVIAVSLLASGCLQRSAAQSFQPAFPHSPTDSLEFVTDALGDGRGPGSLILKATCGQNGEVIPRVILHPPVGPFRNAPEALTDLSLVDPRISWRRGAAGTIRVSDGNVRDGLLRLRLRRVRFRHRSDPVAALQDIFSTPEVRFYLKQKQVEKGFFSISRGGLLPGVAKNIRPPRLSSVLRDTTVAGALDRIARFFDGFWVYAECQDGQRMRILIDAFQTGGW